MLNLSPKELKVIAKMRGIKGYKSISEDRLLNAIKASESLKENEKNFDDTKRKIKFPESRTEEIRKINKIRRNLYEIENAKNLSASKINEIEKKSS